MTKTVEQSLLDRIVYIGEQIPEGVANDPRPKFVLLGCPQDFLDETGDARYWTEVGRKSGLAEAQQALEKLRTNAVMRK